MKIGIIVAISVPATALRQLGRGFLRNEPVPRKRRPYRRRVAIQLSSLKSEGERLLKHHDPRLSCDSQDLACTPCCQMGALPSGRPLGGAKGLRKLAQTPAYINYAVASPWIGLG